MGPQLRRASDPDDRDDDFVAEPVTEINVTPFVDVMLVLLIVFMVAAPLMTAGVPIQLPSTQAPRSEEPRQAIIVTVDKDGAPWIDREMLVDDGLAARLAVLARADPTRPVLVRGDRGVPYGRVMEVMGAIGAAGFARVSLISSAMPGAGAPAP